MDLALHSEFLTYANQGVSLNITSFYQPTLIYIITGRAWRWELPVDCRLRTSINSLEFLACVIKVRLDIRLGLVQEEDCILSQTDNSTAAGRLRKSNFADGIDEHIQLSTARKLATLLIE
jgi:hypothetical protein